MGTTLFTLYLCMKYLLSNMRVVVIPGEIAKIVGCQVKVGELG